MSDKKETKPEVQLRGMLTERIKKASMSLLGYEITQTELRLMVFVQYALVNTQRLQYQNLNNEDCAILHKWRLAGNFEETHKITIPKKFWDAMCELIYLGYVDLTEEKR